MTETATPHPEVDKPFSADSEQVMARIGPSGERSESRIRGRQLRDRKGRLRSAFLSGDMPGGASAALLADPLTNRAVLVDATTGRQVSARAPAPVPGGPLEALNEPRWPHLGRPTVVQPGQNQIEGLVCRGIRLSFEDGTIERWESDRIGSDNPVLVRSKIAGQEYELRLSRIALSDPDPALFAPLDSAQ